MRFKPVSPTLFKDIKNREEFIRWLDRWTFTRFVTLTFNDPEAASASVAGSALDHVFLRERLKKWDALTNGAILGRDWAKRHHDRMFAFYFLEKPSTNPHWHGLVRFDASIQAERSKQERLFDESADRNWRKLVPTGTTDIQPVSDRRKLIKYVVKTLPYELSSIQFITPDEFVG